MVEHMSAQTKQHQHEQSFNGVQTQRWHNRNRHWQLESPDLTSGGSGSSHRFSLFRWFKRRDSSGDNRRRQLFRKAKRRPSTSSTSSSVDTFYSTATVRSFAFLSGARRAGGDASLTLEQSSNTVGPFAPGAVKLVEKRLNAATTCTLPTGFSQRQDIQTRYSLHPANNPFISYDSIPVVERRPRTFAEVRKNKNNNNVAVIVDAHLNDSTISGIRRVHVKGKRRAPDPPNQRIINTHATGGTGDYRVTCGGRRKRRPAPKPPGYSETLSSNQDTLSSGTSTGMDTFLSNKDCQIISNDTLVLHRGVLLSKRDVHSPSKSKSDQNPETLVYDSDTGGAIAIDQNKVNNIKANTKMPRPWYKRNILSENSSSGSRDSSTNTRRGGGDILRGIPSPLPSEPRDENVSSTSTSSTLSSSFPFEGSLSRLGFFHRGERHHHDDKKKENKRKSGVSILTNISELDKEAAAIVQEEQARNRASMILQTARMDEDFEKRMRANENIVQEIVNSSIESSPRKSTRALISKFNALGNITKVTVNSNFFTKNNDASPKAKAKRYSQDCTNARIENLDQRINLPKYFISHQSSPKRESPSIFTEDINKPREPTKLPNTPITLGAVKNTTPQTDGSSNNNELVKSLAAELDDVASGIARLRRELDESPRLSENTNNDRDKVTNLKTDNYRNGSKLNAARDRELANFDKEFTKIFNEIDRHLRTKETKIISNKSKVKTNSKETAISSQVAKVLDILVGTEKDATATKNVTPSIKERKATSSLEDLGGKQTKTKGKASSVIRISGVDDKTTTELKEMLKEMKHSLPKRPKEKRSVEVENIPKEEEKPLEAINNKPSTSAYRATVQVPIAPKISMKVSSGVQTSGNVRRIVNDVTTAPNPRAKENNVIPETSAKNGLPKNSYHLIKANEFAEIEAPKSKTHLENTYANVIERSLYANAQVAPSADKGLEKEERESTSRVKIDLRGGDSKVTASPVLPDPQRNGSFSTQKTDATEGEKLEEIKKQYMNTMAVNRLLRKLEAAIASGNHQQAATLAKELAQLKIHCSVVRQRSCNTKEKLNLNMYIEDKQAHQGPIPLQLPANMTVAQLKAKIHIEFEIPANVQRWIIGKNLADNDESTLEELQAVEGSPVFLYLIAPPDVQDKEAITTDKDKDETKTEEQMNQVINKKNDEEIHEIKAEIEPGPEPELEPQSEPAAEAQVEPQPEENGDSLSKEEKLKRYEELMSLENCDVILNTEPIECPVCFMIAIAGEGVTLRDCLHSFCRICVANTVRYCEEAEVKCPYRDADYTCDSTLQEREIKALVAPEVYQQHLAKSIAQAENNAGNNAFHCKTPDCPGWCIYDDNVNNFLCPVCNVNNCLTCQAVHMGKNCRQYQEELKYSKETDHESKRTALMLEEMVDRGEALPCPTCAVVLMKKWGCDWLRCSMCKTEICWVTRGPRWGPGGKGDTSGGCRCGENGVKCHPRCNYCH